MKVSEYFPAHVRAIYREIRRARRDVLEDTGEDAIHDLRVGVRRLRSILRSVRGVFGEFHVATISSNIKSVIEHSNALRDAEVLRKVLKDLALVPHAAKAVETWLREHGENEKLVCGELKVELAGTSVNHALRQLDALFSLPLRSSRDEEVEELALRVLDRQRRKLLKAIGDEEKSICDFDRMHRARIEAKRLRYVGEFYVRFVPRPLRRHTRAARTLQGLFGDLHDLDMLMQHFADDETIDMTARADLLLRLSEKRSALAAESMKPIARAVKALRA